jgi:hypothetical protein
MELCILSRAGLKLYTANGWVALGLRQGIGREEKIETIQFV